MTPALSCVSAVVGWGSDPHHFNALTHWGSDPQRFNALPRWGSDPGCGEALRC